MSWQDAVWAAVRRQAAVGAVTRQGLIAHEMERIVADTGSRGTTPAQTLSRVLQELRDEGVLLFEGDGVYRVAADAARLTLAEALVTERAAYVTQRVGQGSFRRALLDAFGACQATGVADGELLVASHIVPWARCATDAERLEPENGLLLSALWDAAFDRLLVTFGDDGEAEASPRLSGRGRDVLRGAWAGPLAGLTAGRRKRLGLHRAAMKAGKWPADAVVVGGGAVVHGG